MSNEFGLGLIGNGAIEDLWTGAVTSLVDTCHDKIALMKMWKMGWRK